MPLLSQAQQFIRRMALLFEMLPLFFMVYENVYLLLLGLSEFFPSESLINKKKESAVFFFFFYTREAEGAW